MRISVLQMTSGIDPDANVAAIIDAIGAAKSGGAAMLFTPEMSTLLDRDRERARPHIVDEASSRALIAICDAARAAGIWVHLGSMPLQADDADGRFANRGFVIDDQGHVRARYDKIHLFDVDLPTGESWRESSAYRAGERAVIVSTPIGTLGLSVCYDLRFPGLYNGLSGAGAEILSIPAAFTVPTGAAHWHVLVRARAIENACWVVAAAQTGHHADGRETYGHTLVVDPWGEIVLDMGQGPGMAFAEIDLDRVADARHRIPVLAHRRPVSEVDIA